MDNVDCLGGCAASSPTIFSVPTDLVRTPWGGGRPVQQPPNRLGPCLLFPTRRGKCVKCERNPGLVTESGVGCASSWRARQNKRSHELAVLRHSRAHGL